MLSSHVLIDFGNILNPYPYIRQNFDSVPIHPTKLLWNHREVKMFTSFAPVVKILLQNYFNEFTVIKSLIRRDFGKLANFIKNG